jgi:hypothetical protein
MSLIYNYRCFKCASNVQISFFFIDIEPFFEKKLGVVVTGPSVEPRVFQTNGPNTLRHRERHRTGPPCHCRSVAHR